MPCCLSGPSIRLGWRWGEAHSLVRLPQYLPNRMNSSELCPALYRSIDTICPLLMERGFLSSIRVVNAWIIVGFTSSIVSNICWGQFQLHCISGMSLPHLASTKKRAQPYWQAMFPRFTHRFYLSSSRIRVSRVFICSSDWLE